MDEAVARDAVRVPQEAVRTWLKTWGTAEEDAADATLQAIEERLPRDAQDAARERGLPGRPTWLSSTTFTII